MKKRLMKMTAVLLTISTLYSTVTYAGIQQSTTLQQESSNPITNNNFVPGLNNGILKSLAASNEYVADTWSGIIPKGTEGKVMQVYTLSRFTIKQKSHIGIKVKQQKTENTVPLTSTIDYFLVPDSNFNNRIGNSLNLLADYPGMYGQYAYTQWTDVLPGTYVIRVKQAYTPYRTTGEVIITPTS